MRDGAGHHQVDDAGRGEHGEELEVLADDLLARKVSSLTKITEAIEVPLITLMKSLAMPGRMARIACGRMIRRSVRNGPMPKRGRGDALVAVHRKDAAADDLGAESRLVEGEAEHRGDEAVELDAERRQRVVEKDELEKLRRAAHEPDIGPRQRPERREAATAASGRGPGRRASPPTIASAEISTASSAPSRRKGSTT